MTHSLVEEVVDDVVEVREDVRELRQGIGNAELVHLDDRRPVPSFRRLVVVIADCMRGRSGG